MLLRCTSTFETREGGYSKEIEEDSVWQVVGMDYADGGYELAKLDRVGYREYVDHAVIRLSRLQSNFEAVNEDEVNE